MQILPEQFFYLKRKMSCENEILSTQFKCS